MAEAVYKVNYNEANCACPIDWIGPQLDGTCYGQTFMFMMMLRHFIMGRCDLADPCNRFPPDRQPDESYDFVVIGGGTAGAVVAGRLAENPAWKVLVLEAGGDEPPISAVPALLTSYWWNNETDWLYYTEPQEKACLREPEKKCYWPRAKMFGGTAAFNGMMYTRGHAADYDGWAINGAKGWSWQEVFPYFLMSEDNLQIGKVSRQWHNQGGPMPVQQFRHAPVFAHDVIAASIEMGFPPTTDLNGDNITGFTIAQAFNKDGSRYTTTRGYLRPKSHQKNIHVVFHAHVSQLLIDPVLKKVTGVEYIDLKTNQKKQVKVKKEAIVSGGTMNSPQILMLSGIGPKETLDKFNIPTIANLPGVGQNLQNHVGVDLKFELTGVKDTPELNFASAAEYLLERNGPLSSTQMSQVTGFANSPYAPAGGRHPDIQLFFRGYDADCADGSTPHPGQVESNREIGISAVNIQPRSRGYITIRSVEPLDKPIFQPNYLYDEHDVNVLVEAAKISFRLANTTILRTKYGMIPKPGYGEESCGTADPNNVEYLKCLIHHHTAPENHQAGTCKMGPESDPMAVVDMELKVHGIEGLRVIDASIMPVVNTGNTMAPTIMIAERGARFLINKYQQQNRNQPGLLGNRFGDSQSASIEHRDKKKYEVCIEKVPLRELTLGEILRGWNFGELDNNPKDERITDTENLSSQDSNSEWGPDSNKKWGQDSNREWGQDSNKKWSQDSNREWGPESNKKWGTDSNKQWGTDSNKQWGTDSNKQWGVEPNKEWSQDSNKWNQGGNSNKQWNNGAWPQASQWQAKPWPQRQHTWEHKNGQYQHDPEWHKKNDGLNVKA